VASRGLAVECQESTSHMGYAPSANVFVVLQSCHAPTLGRRHDAEFFAASFAEALAIMKALPLGWQNEGVQVVSSKKPILADRLLVDSAFQNASGHLCRLANGQSLADNCPVTAQPGRHALVYTHLLGPVAS
jgi:hypothetical protein